VGPTRTLNFKNERSNNNIKIVIPCGGSSQCPVVKIPETQAEIEEKGNTCVLTKEQWETLKGKILKREL